jgi:hypothetical protein
MWCELHCSPNQILTETNRSIPTTATKRIQSELWLDWKSQHLQIGLLLAEICYGIRLMKHRYFYRTIK